MSEQEHMAKLEREFAEMFPDIDAMKLQLTTLTQERDALREENARLRQLVTKLVAGDQMTLAS